MDVNYLHDETLSSASDRPRSALFQYTENTVKTGTRTELVEVVVVVVVSVVVVEPRSLGHPDLRLSSAYLTEIVPRVGREEEPLNY